MKRLATLACALCLSAPAHADVDAALDRHILPGLQAFADATAALSQGADADCLADAVQPRFHAAFDAWMPVADLRLGPSEAGALSVAFWPDARGFTQRTLTRLIADQDPAAQDPAAYAEVSIAARGLFALDMLLYDPAFSDYDKGSYTCTLVATITTDLHRQADALAAAWQDGYADTLRTAGQAGNATFLTEDEAVRANRLALLEGVRREIGAVAAHPDHPFRQTRCADRWCIRWSAHGRRPVEQRSTQCRPPRHRSRCCCPSQTHPPYRS
jgi:predicted lipoprotein